MLDTPKAIVALSENLLQQGNIIPFPDSLKKSRQFIDFNLRFERRARKFLYLYLDSRMRFLYCFFKKHFKANITVQTISERKTKKKWRCYSMQQSNASNDILYVCSMHTAIAFIFRYAKYINKKRKIQRTLCSLDARVSRNRCLINKTNAYTGSCPDFSDMVLFL